MKLSDIKDPDLLTEKVEHEGVTLQVLSTDSTAYNDFIRSTWLKNSMRESEPTDSELSIVDRVGAAKLVKSWSLEDECTTENVAELFRRKRSFVMEVYIAASRLGKHETKELNNSCDGASEDSGSGENTKAAKARAKNIGGKSKKARNVTV